MTATDAEIEQLAMFTAALNAKLYGAELKPGVYLPTWDDLGPAGQEAYLNDARVQFEAVERILAKRPTAEKALRAEDLLDTRAGLALANAAWREGASAMLRSVNEHKLGPWQKPASPYSVPGSPDRNGSNS
jgi:hypothetical protein